MVKLLIDFGANLNAPNADPPKWAPLHFAAYEGHADVVGLLVASGAIPDVQDSQGDTPESWALDWENFKCAMILGEHMTSKLLNCHLFDSYLFNCVGDE